MPPLVSSSSDDVMQLPSVPRLRRGSEKATTDSAAEHSPSKLKKDERFGSLKRKPREMARGRRKGKRTAESLHSDEDENVDESEEVPPVRRTKRVPRRTLQARKIVDDEDEDDQDDEDDEDMEVDTGNSHSPSPRPKRKKKTTRIKEMSSDKSNSSSPPPPKKKKKKTSRIKDMSSDSNSKEDGGTENSNSQSTPSTEKKSTPKAKNTSSDSNGKDDDAGTDEQNAGINDFMQNEVLAKLEEEAENDGNEDSDQFDSDDSEEEKESRKKPERLTRRQRAMQGENVDLEYTKLESPKSKKQTSPEDEWSHDEEVELKKQQKARLRQMINEKRNKEKRAAMVDKVLRGVTSKRKKLTMASEARAAQVGTRLSQNEMREGCIRFVSNRDGISLSLPKESDEPVYLQSSVKAVYPRACKRDPRTGKRIFA